jgi:hypothetical protein
MMQNPMTIELPIPLFTHSKIIYIYFVVFPLNGALKCIHAISLNIKNSQCTSKLVCNHPFVPIFPRFDKTTHVIFHPIEDIAQMQGFITPYQMICVNIGTYYFEE